MKKIKVVKKPVRGKITSKKDFKPKNLDIPEKDKKFIPFAEYIKKKSS